MTCYTADFAGTLTADQEIEELRWIGSSCPAVKDTAASAALSLACHCLSTIFPPHFLALALPLRPPLPWHATAFPLCFHRQLPLPCVSTAFVAKTLLLPCDSTDFPAAKTLPLPCVSAALVAKPLPLPCLSIAVVA